MNSSFNKFAKERQMVIGKGPSGRGTWFYVCVHFTWEVAKT